MSAQTQARVSGDSSAAEESEMSAGCSVRWHLVADSQALWALADIVFATVSSIYVNDRPSENRLKLKE